MTEPKTLVQIRKLRESGVKSARAIQRETGLDLEDIHDALIELRKPVQYEVTVNVSESFL